MGTIGDAITHYIPEERLLTSRMFVLDLERLYGLTFFYGKDSGYILRCISDGLSDSGLRITGQGHGNIL